MSTPRFDLVDIAKALKKRSRYILIVTLLAGLAGLVFYLVSPHKYEGRSEFLVCNPLYSDRNNVFRNIESQFINYFGNEDDVDKVIAIAKSELVRVRVFEKQDLYKHYGVDTSDKVAVARLIKQFKKNCDFKRTEYQNMEVSFLDNDPRMAANVTNEVVNVIGEVYKGYYSNIRNNITIALKAKLQETDSTIASMTDTLSRLRDRYQIYDIISPARQTMINASLKSNGTSGYGRGVEEIQNVEATKDQLVKDRASYISLINEFTTGARLNEMPLVQVITPASPDVDPKGPGLVLTVIACLFIGFFFSAIWVLLSTYFRILAATER